jgi:hypothetical protein
MVQQVGKANNRSGRYPCCWRLNQGFVLAVSTLLQFDHTSRAVNFQRHFNARILFLFIVVIPF